MLYSDPEPGADTIVKVALAEGVPGGWVQTSASASHWPEAQTWAVGPSSLEEQPLKSDASTGLNAPVEMNVPLVWRSGRAQHVQGV